MSESIKPASHESSGAAEFLAERPSRLKASEAKTGRLNRQVKRYRLSKAADQLVAALPPSEGKRSHSADPGRIADALLAFVNECRKLKADNCLDRVTLPGAAIEAEKIARELYRIAAKIDRKALIVQIKSLGGHPSDFQGDVWALVGWLTQEIVHGPKQHQISKKVTPELLIGLGESHDDPTTRILLETHHQQTPSAPNSPGRMPEPLTDLDAHTAPQPTSRLTLDQDSLTIIFDGTSYAHIDPVAFHLFKAIYDGKGLPVGPNELNRLPRMRGKNLPRELNKLPGPLRALVKGKGGKGRWVELPPNWAWFNFG
jgi:hypothetical protein